MTDMIERDVAVDGAVVNAGERSASPVSMALNRAGFAGGFNS